MQCIITHIYIIYTCTRIMYRCIFQKTFRQDPETLFLRNDLLNSRNLYGGCCIYINIIYATSVIYFLCRGLQKGYKRDERPGAAPPLEITARQTLQSSSWRNNHNSSFILFFSFRFFSSYTIRGFVRFLIFPSSCRPLPYYNNTYMYTCTINMPHPVGSGQARGNCRQSILLAHRSR